MTKIERKKKFKKLKVQLSPPDKKNNQKINKSQNRFDKGPTMADCPSPQIHCNLQPWTKTNFTGKYSISYVYGNG